MRFDVVGLGTAACDYVTRVDRFPAADEKVRSTDLTVVSGGTVGTALITVARLGLEAAFAGSVGEDDWGRLILASLEREGVDTALAAVVPGARSPFSFCVSSPPHRNVFSIAATTPPRALRPAELEAMLNARFVHLDGADAEAALDLAREAHKRGVGVSLDFQRVKPNTEQLLACADVAVVSESFARECFGPRPAEAAVGRLWRSGMKLAAITMGPGGVVATEGGEPYRVPAEPIDVVDSTGAGDVFHGALLVALLEGRSAPEALRFAAHVAGLSCRSLGGPTGIPRRDELGSDWPRS